MTSTGRARTHLRQIALVAAALAVCLISPAVAAADWPFYGRDLSNSRNAGRDGPTPAQVKTLQPFWSFTSTQGDFTGTPVESAGIVVAGSNGGVVDALDASTGAPIGL
jgi:glucose dehydrogenase